MQGGLVQLEHAVQGGQGCAQVALVSHLARELAEAQHQGVACAQLRTQKHCVRLGHRSGTSLLSRGQTWLSAESVSCR